MRPLPAVVLAYVATVATVPFVFWVAMQLWPLPMPYRLYLASPVEAFALTCLLALIGSLPGFILTRAGLWWIGVTSPLAFVLTGAATGYSAVVLLCLPSDVWALRAYRVDLFGLGIGAIAGFAHRTVEAVFGGFIAKRVTSAGERGTAS